MIPQREEGNRDQNQGKETSADPPCPVTARAHLRSDEAGQPFNFRKQKDKKKRKNRNKESVVGTERQKQMHCQIENHIDVHEPGTFNQPSSKARYDQEKNGGDNHQP